MKAIFPGTCSVCGGTYAPRTDEIDYTGATGPRGGKLTAHVKCLGKKSKAPRRKNGTPAEKTFVVARGDSPDTLHTEPIEFPCYIPTYEWDGPRRPDGTRKIKTVYLRADSHADILRILREHQSSDDPAIDTLPSPMALVAAYPKSTYKGRPVYEPDL